MPLLYDVSEAKRKRVIIDTDAACEADDPFAIAHALLCKKFEVKAVLAEHFGVPGSVKRSYDEISEFGLLKGTKVVENLPVLFPRNDLKEVLAKSEIIKEKQLKEYNEVLSKENANKVELIDIMTNRRRVANLLYA